MARRMVAMLVALMPLGATAARAATTTPEAKAEGYLEWRSGELLIVDGQRVRPAHGLKFSGKGEARDPASVPLGYELKAKGVRATDGVLLAREIEAKPNGRAMFESEVIAATDEAEKSYRRAGRFFETAGGRTQNIGRLYESGPDVDRVRGVVDALVPPYMSPDDFRVYVIENKEWNAFAMGNRSIYVFSGLLKDLDDDELAIVLGHEMVHATHEHTRKQVKKQMWIEIAALGVTAAATEIDDKNKRAVVDLITLLGASIYSNGYGRDLEDQADRVGLRYAYEAGYEITQGPRLWNRFAKKYGEGNKVMNFLFSDHSRSAARAANLERELAFNYPEGPKTGTDTPRARAMTDPPRASGPVRVDATPLPRSGGAPSGTAALAGPPAGRTQRADLKPGMTPDEVRSLLGSPRDEVVFGARTRWTYPDLTVIFENGHVTEVRF